jgi:hypothetical protein
MSAGAAKEVFSSAAALRKGGEPGGPPTAGFSIRDEVWVTVTSGVLARRSRAARMLRSRSPRLAPSAMYAVTDGTALLPLPLATVDVVRGNASYASGRGLG